MKADRQTRLELWMGIAVFMILFAAACATTDDPLKVGELKDPTPTPTVAPVSPTPAVVSGNPTAAPQETAARPSAASAAGPPKDELIKFANWDDNRVKLTNWLAGYMIAHGIDRPVRLIKTTPNDYQSALLANDVDIVLEALSMWAQEQADAGKVLILGTLVADNADTVIAVHPSMGERAPDVIEFLRAYRPDADVIREEATKIRGGRIAITENVVGLGIFKNMEEMWTPWLSAAQAEAVRIEVGARTVGLCREWEIRLGDAFRIRYCKDDPRIVGGR